MISSDAPSKIPATLLLPLLRDLSLHGVALDSVLQCPGGVLPEKPLLRGELVELDRCDFIHAYGQSTLLLEQAVCRTQTRSENRSFALKTLLNFVVGAETLKAACEHAADFNQVLEEKGYSLRLKIIGDSAKFEMDCYPLVERPPMSLVAASLLFFYNLFSWLAAVPLNLAQVRLAYPFNLGGNPCLDILGVPVHYGSDENSLIFSASDLSLKIVRTQTDLWGFSDAIAYDPLLFARSSTPMSNQVRAVLRDMCQRGENLSGSQRIVELLGVSPSTLSRRLKEENTSFLILKAECQEEVAKFMLRQNALSILEIAMKLGFGDVRSFRRAFVSWTGVLPSTFRTQSARIGPMKT